MMAEFFFESDLMRCGIITWRKESCSYFRQLYHTSKYWKVKQKIVLLLADTMALIQPLQGVIKTLKTLTEEYEKNNNQVPVRD